MKVDDMEGVGFAIQPKTDCPHLGEKEASSIANFLSKIKCKIGDLRCKDCLDQNENWVCVECLSVFCSRYVKGHMVGHNEATQHPVALSFSDGSYWCYTCDSYIDTPLLRPARAALTKLKIAEEQAGKEKQKELSEEEKKKAEEVEKLLNLMGLGEEPKEEEILKITFEEIAAGFKEKKYKNVVVLTGAGLSTAAGIPDFRTPGTGLYSKLAKYKLPYPEAMFELTYFKKQPEAFLGLASAMLTQEYEPTLGHRFIKKLQDEGILLQNLTQNIDDLEIKAGVKEDRLLQAHGHSRQAHCIDCKKEANIKEWKELAAKQVPMKCKECEGLIKPDIVFFGQQLPDSFFTAPETMKKADIAIIIGTSLQVQPFAYLAQLIPKTSPIILINRDDVVHRKDLKLWMEGDIQDNVAKLMEAIGWKQ